MPAGARPIEVSNAKWSVGLAVVLPVGRRRLARPRQPLRGIIWPLAKRAQLKAGPSCHGDSPQQAECWADDSSWAGGAIAQEQLVRGSKPLLKRMGGKFLFFSLPAVREAWVDETQRSLRTYLM